MLEQDVQFTFNARYYQLGKISVHTKHLWIVFHGYGQLASEFLNHFTLLQDEHNCIIAPEALSRFYLRGFSGTVGASWMTKEDRLTDISNYLNFVSEIYKKLEQQLPTCTQVHLIGFSQGAATASRFAMLSNFSFDSITLWGGILPPDLNYNFTEEKLNGKKVFLVYGRDDKFIHPNDIQETEAILKRIKANPIVIDYEGKHKIMEDPLIQIKEIVIKGFLA